jgi:hypothetical protein
MESLQALFILYLCCQVSKLMSANECKINLHGRKAL